MDRIQAGLLALLVLPSVTTASETDPGWTFHSVSDQRSYAIYMVAGGDAGCNLVRYRVTDGRRMLAETHLVAPGEAVVVRIGSGFAQGAHNLKIRAIGCPQPPALARRIALGKRSPDHGWRAGVGP